MFAFANANSTSSSMKPPTVPPLGSTALVPVTKKPTTGTSNTDATTPPVRELITTIIATPRVHSYQNHSVFDWDRVPAPSQSFRRPSLHARQVASDGSNDLCTIRGYFPIFMSLPPSRVSHRPPLDIRKSSLGISSLSATSAALANDAISISHVRNHAAFSSARS